jgi:selenide,water dikinase
MIATTTLLNRIGADLGGDAAVHAVTDVTGFGLAGHLLEICRGSKLAATVDFDALPLIEEAVRHVRAGIATGASTRNWASYGEAVSIGGEEWRQKVVTDPQTSGGLLVACAPEAADEVLAAFRGDGFARAVIVGRMAAGEPRVTVV